jgi:drug/metabolite transporter (DMT)-like permease
MLASCAFLSIVSTLARYAALEGVPLFQIVFLRLCFALLVLLPLIARRWPAILQTSQPGLYVWRVGVGLLAMISWFGALSLIPVGDVTAISFLTPLFGTLAAILFLKEKTSRQRLLALGLGFTGALIILRPGYIETGTGMWVAILAACAMAASSILIKRLTEIDEPDKVVVISTVCQTPLLAIPGLYVWSPLTLELWGVFLVMGFFATLGQICLSRAFAATDIGITMGVDFARLPFAVLFGYIMFGELSDTWTWIGAAVIMVGTLIAARANGKLPPRV